MTINHSGDGSDVSKPKEASAKKEGGLEKKASKLSGVGGLIIGAVLGCLTGTFIGSYLTAPEPITPTDLNNDGIRDSIVYLENQDQPYVGTMDGKLIPLEYFLNMKKTERYEGAESEISRLKKQIEENLQKFNQEE